jgi:hypothetical protein
VQISLSAAVTLPFSTASPGVPHHSARSGCWRLGRSAICAARQSGEWEGEEGSCVWATFSAIQADEQLTLSQGVDTSLDETK